MLFFVIMKKNCLNECPPQLEAVAYRRCVGDFFVLLKSEEHLKVFVNYMNSKHKNIKCTFEAENLNSFSFLDVKITHKNKRFVTSIFHKATLLEFLLITIVLFLIPIR